MSDLAHHIRAQLVASIEEVDGRVVSRVSEATPPLELRGPLPADGREFFLRNVSCGVFAGDQYHARICAGPDARAIVRSPVATMVHPGVTSEPSLIRTSLDAAPGARLAFLDGPTILQRGSAHSQCVEIIARPGAIIAYGEVLVFGRLARGELLEFERFAHRLSVRSPDGEARFHEQFEMVPARDRDTILAAVAPILGTLIVAGCTNAAVWASIPLEGDGYLAGWSTLPLGAGSVLRLAGERLEPVLDLIRRGAAAVQTVD